MHSRKVCHVKYLSIFRGSKESKSECSHKSLNASAIWILHEPYSCTVHPFISFHRGGNLQSLAILLQSTCFKQYGYTVLQMEMKIHLIQLLLAVLLHFTLVPFFISGNKCNRYIHISFSTYRLNPNASWIYKCCVII